MNRYADNVGGIAFRDISVTYGPTRALDGVNLAVVPGQVVGLMGHNGAGKSTLLNVATGAVKPDRGTIVLGDQQVQKYGDPRYFAELGITVIHQEPALAPNLSILDNLTLARSRTGDQADIRAQARAVLARLGIERDIRTPVSMLSLGERQMVDLARGLLPGEIKVLLLDEPAAALGPGETQTLHQTVRSLASAGTAVVYVSHRLPDILDICSRIVVLREGKKVLEAERSHYTSSTLAKALAPDTEAASRTRVFKEADQAVEIPWGRQRIAAAQGEVLGLFGVAAGEQFEILKRLYGLGSPLRMYLNGRSFSAFSPAHARSAGIHLVPPDRERDGLVPQMSAVDNVFLPWLRDGRAADVRTRGQRAERYENIRQTFAIRGPGGDAPITSFSGGNRQKHLLARWMSVVPPKVLLLAQPTQGVDEAAKSDIRRAIYQLAERGVCIVVASAESDELSSLCDRVIVMSGDRMTEVLPSDQYDSHLLEALSREETSHAV